MRLEREAREPALIQIREHARQPSREPDAVEAEHRLQNRNRIAEAQCAEEHPRKMDEQERHNPSQNRIHLKPGQFPVAADDTCQSVHDAPDQERPSGAVPDARHQEDDEDIDVCPHFPFAVPAERDVDIRRQKMRQCDMPAAPEILDVARLIGRIEVQRQADVEQ